MASRFIRRLASGVRAASIEPGLRPGNTGGPVYGKNLKGSQQGYGGMITPPAGKGVVKAATTSVRFVAPGQPLYNEWDGIDAIQKGYLGHGYVMRCVRLRAETLAGLPFVAGPDPTDPTVTDPNSQLARFLGPATPQAPGGPNPQIDARNMWIWTLIQYIVTGKFAWEQARSADSATAPIMELWPLVSGLLQPIPAPFGSSRYFQSYVYQTTGGDRPLKDYQCLYHWRMSAQDPYQAESVLQAAMMPAQIAIASDKYMWSLLSKGMVAPKMVITPDFEEDAARRAWEDQFTSEYTGYDNAGKVIFGYLDGDESGGSGTGNAMERSNIQVIDLAMKSVDAQLLDMVKQAKTDLEVALGVPESLLGNACLKSDELVHLEDGRRVQAHSLVGQHFKVLTSTPDGPEPREAYATWNAVEPTFAVTTESGNRLMCNDQHPLYMAKYMSGEGVSVHGWTRLGYLVAGDLLAVVDSDNWPRPEWWRTRHLNPGLRWEKVTSITPLGIDATVCITVPEGNTYLSTFWEHNSQRIFCVDSETEALTADGWRRHEELGPDAKILTLDHQTGMTEWQPCDKINRFDVVNERMLAMTGPTHDSLTTAAHRWPVLVGEDDGTPDWRLSDSLRDTDRLLTTIDGSGPAPCLVGDLHREWVTYSGTVWCPSLANGTWMARRNGKVFFTGNSNAGAEERNFWTITAINDVAEIQDAINLRFAPELDPRLVGWFDLSNVVSLQPPTVFAPPDVKDMLDEGVVTPEDVQKILNLPGLESPNEDLDTAPIGEEAVQSGAVGGRSMGFRRATRRNIGASEGWRSVYGGMRLAENVFVRRLPLTITTLGIGGRPGSGIWRVERHRERAKLALPSGVRAETPALAREVSATVAQVRRKREGIRSDERVKELEAENEMLRTAAAAQAELLISADGSRSLDDIDALLDLCGDQLLAAVQPD